ncbi:hypothetical protein [Leptospira santarosai]|uniref:hypothetical protein n=1 Tax=Leptospira santarosai TaxID=28183 RepID=UPI000517FD94|nr:hypothetical protein [Leptospira santarosai]
MDSDQIIIEILNKIGNQVNFTYPGKEGQKHGTLEDRSVIESANFPYAVPYWDAVDLIKFENEKEYWMRIGYYRKPKDKLVWGTQTTITEPLSIWKKIIIQTAKEKPWFRELLSEVTKELFL